MPDYKRMYLQLFHATDKAINALITAQRVCEELYVTGSEPEISILQCRGDQHEEAESG